MSQETKEALHEAKESAYVDNRHYRRIAGNLRKVDAKLADKLEKVADAAQDVGEDIKKRAE